MPQESVNERLNFLIKSLNLSARAFSAAIGVPDSNTRNYLSRGTRLNAEYLESIVSHFSNVSLNWLVTGNGEPFISESNAPNRLDVSGSNNNVATGTGSKAVQKNKYTFDDCARERDEYRDKLEAARREIELLTGQVQMQRTIIEGKDQMLDLLRGSVNRPN